uniref:Histidine acid n=1 Tax=Colletotrichum fructicola (strain Nara gc5) TaxID=1213859 RepID=L2GF13_COLFN
MYTPSVIAFTAALLATATAQSSNPTVWASVALMMHGERTPLRSELSDVLTPRGAQQLYAQGNAFRTRYLSGITPTNSSESQVTSRAPIRDIAPNVVDHAQLHILSVPDAHVVAGAQAFMQALYPPISHTFSVDTGGSNVSFSTTSGNYTEYPLDGYQYPVIQTAGYLDQRSIGLRGNTECTQWQVSTQVDMTRDPDMLKLYNSTKAKYQSFFTTPPLNDGAVYNALMDAYVKDSQFLQVYSRQQQLALYSDQKPSGLAKGDMIRTVAGMSFAKQVVDALKANGNFGGYSRKLTLLFSSQEPFLSFFSLAQLQQGNTSLSSPFWNPGRPDSYPKDSNLYVRFLYRKNADPGTAFEEYALFGSPAAEPRVTFSYFKQEMLKFGVDVATWCSMCASSQPFCSVRSTEAPTIGATIRAVVRKPYVAGIIGGAIVLAVLGLVVAAFVLAGFRIRRMGKEDNKDGHQPAASLGGFKAAEKMASDPDLSVSKRGVPHERHGSWELREGRDVVTGVHGAGISVDKSSSASSVHSKDLDDDGASVMGASPVTPRESV